MKMSKIILIGSLTKDVIYIDNLSKTSIGGSVFYASEAFNQFGDDVSLIPLLSMDNKKLLKDIHRKIKTHPIYIKSTFTFENIYSQKKLFHRTQKVVEKMEDSILTENIPLLKFHEADLVFAGPQSSWDISLDVLKYINKMNKRICLYSQGYFRELTSRGIKGAPWEDAPKYLKLASTVIISEDHLRLLFKDNDIEKGLKGISKMGPSEVILSRGKNGFMIYSGEENRIVNSSYFNTEGFVNPNGLTSTYAAVYLSMRLLGKSIEECAEYAITAAYVKMSNWLPLRKPKKRIEEIMEIRKVLPRL